MDDQPPLPIRVVLLEDSDSDAQLILFQMKKDGLSVECRQVSNEADFTAALSWPPDLILSDYALPRFDGLHALQITRQHGLDIPFILISGAVGEDVIVQVIKQGADDYIMKDRLTRLGSAIHNALEQKRLRQEKKLSDNALHESQERYRLITQLAEDIIWTMDMNLRFTYISPSFERALGYSSSEIMALQFDQFLTSESLANGLKVFHEEVEKAQPQLNIINARVLELEYRRKDQSTFWVEMKFSFFRGVNGEPTGILGVGRDITRRKRIEDDLHKAETKYRNLVEQIPPIVYIADLHQHIGVTYISPRIEELGFTREEWISDPELWLRQIHPEDRNRILAEIDESVENKKLFRSEYRLLTRDGEIRWFLDEALDVADGDGKLLYRQGFMLDITERKIAEEALALREQFMHALNGMTHAILLSKDFDSTLQVLAFEITKLLNADDCFITYWDEERKLTLPITTTAESENTFSEDRIFNINEPSLTATVIKAGHVLAVDDVLNTPYMSAETARQYPARSVLGIPLIAGDHKLGAAVIAYNAHHQFTADEIERAAQLGNQIALTLWNYHQGIEIQQQLKQSRTLTDIGRALSEIERVGSDRVLQLIVDSALDLIPTAEQAVIHIVDADRKFLTPMAIAGYLEKREGSLQMKMQMGKGVAGQVIRDGITMNISNVEEDPRFLRIAKTPTFRSLMVAPIQIGGEQIGTISMQSKIASAFSTEDEELLNALAIDAAIAIDNTRSYETTQQSLKEVNALYGTIQVLAASLNEEELARNVVALLQKNFGYYYVQFFQLDPLSTDLVLKAGSGDVGKQLLKDQFRMPRGAGIVGHVAETGVPFYTNDVNNVVFFQRNPLLPDTMFELAVPVKVSQEVVGVLDIQDKPPRQLSQRDLQLVQAVGDQLAVALHKANLYTDLQNTMQLEQSIRSQLIQSERLALVGRLLASVSHELNNPLQAIQNALFLLQEESGLSRQGRQDLEIVLSETERMAALIERLRSAYRPIRGKDFQPVPLNNLIEDVYALINTHMRHKDIVFEFIPDPNLQSVPGISDQLRQVVLNLFLNAIEVMNPGGRLTVQTQNLIDQNEVLVTVKDTGPGIDEEILPHIFDAFITNKHTGTGLGLTITHDILQQHRGRISAENGPEGGAVFHVWLPMSEKE